MNNDAVKLCTEEQSRLNLQKDEEAVVNVVSAPVMGLYMSVA